MSDVHSVARDQLRSFIERIENLESEKKTIADDIKDVYGEAKGMGFDGKILKKVIAIRKMDRDERAEQEAILDTYLAALGMIEQPDFFADEPRSAAPVDRQARAALRTSEAMDDNKAFSAQLVADGLISEDAHRENLALSDAIARKYGAGVIDPETGEVFDTPSDAPPASAAAVISSSDDTAKGEAGSPVGLPENSPETATKQRVNVHSQHEGANAQATVQNECVTVVGTESGTVTQVRSASTDAPETPGKQCTSVVSKDEAGQNLTGNPIPKPAPSMDELRIANALILRPNCKRPGQETCGGQGRTHCRDCATAPAEKAREEA